MCVAQCVWNIEYSLNKSIKSDAKADWVLQMDVVKCVSQANTCN